LNARGSGARARRRAIGAALVALVAGCRPRSEGGEAGSSLPLVPSASTSVEAAPSSGPWAPPGLGPPLAPVDLPPFRALGHAGGRYEARLWSSDVAAYRAGEARPGLVVCAEHREGGEPSPADLIACMRREAGGEGAWLYGVMARGAGAWLRVGRLDDCARCHHSAPRDELFGPPAELRSFFSRA
jgi:hypothetical protein